MVPDQPYISWKEAKDILSRDGVVAVPTDTVYGLAANALSPKAVQKIYSVKGRSFNKPLVLMCADISAAKGLVQQWDDDIQRLAQRYWPGALTLVFKRDAGKVPSQVVNSQDTVGIRIPEQKDLLVLLSALSFPLAVTSANLSGDKELVQAEEVKKDFNGKIDGIVQDDQSVQGGVPSTVLDVSVKPWKVLRAGPLKVLEEK